MRPVSVRFGCFGPYMAEQYVDFEELEKNGLFLICGETGAGKTTILDAICYALYGKSSGGLRGGLEVMRCKLAGPEDDTFVEFIFEAGGKRYKFTRSLKYKTGKNKKSRNLNDYHRCVELEGELEIPIVEKEQDRWVTQKAEELIGLTYDQFRQVIILPQGQFEQLLVSDSEKKEAILVSLFHAQRWHRIAEELQRRVAEQDRQLKEERRSIDEKLRHYGCTSLPQLEGAVEDQRQKLEDLLEKTQSAEELLSRAKGIKDRALLEDQAFRELDKRQRSLEALQSQQSHYHAEAGALADANKAEQIRFRYLEHCGAASAYEKCRGSVQRAAKDLEKKQTALEAVCKEQENHDSRKDAVEADRHRLLELKNAREAYSVLEDLAQAARKAESTVKTARDTAHTAEQAFLSADRALTEAFQAQSSAMAVYRKEQEDYLLGIGATLAQELRPGQPCPVCGSREHPEPARAAGRTVTQAQLEEALQTMNQAGDRVTKALGTRSEEEKKRKEAEQTLSEAQKRSAIAAAAWQEALSRRLEGIENERQRSAAQEALSVEIETYDAQTGELNSRFTEAAAEQKTAQSLLEAAEASLSEAWEHCQQQSELWEQALMESGLETLGRYQAADMDSEQRQNRWNALLTFRADLEKAAKDLREQQALLTGSERPDLTGVQRQLEEAEDSHRKCVTAQTLAAQRLEDMTRDLERLIRRMAAWEKNRVRVDGDMVFAKRLRGDHGVSLQRYVLGVMLTSVTTEANRLLANVYGGRYRLYRTDEISGSSRKGGLELEVYDSHNNQRRSVTTLSGGEKFLVALSLAIGLSTVVQAQGGGIRLEAMFIDEGFGSLDRESVGDALEVLQGVRRGCGIVGIISHVEQLAEVIPTRLEITKGRHGSTCTLRG